MLLNIVLQKNLNKVDVYLVDTFGEKKFHNLAPTVLGGSIALKGGQTLLRL